MKVKVRACRAFFQNRINCAFSEALLSAKGNPEFKHRLKWLKEGSLMFHLSHFKGSTCCEKEKALFDELMKTKTCIIL
jgi:hypothetical protein